MPTIPRPRSAVRLVIASVVATALIGVVSLSRADAACETIINGYTWSGGCLTGIGWNTPSNNVIAIQALLNHNYTNSDNVGSEDGYFGTNTKNGVIYFQQDEGLTADGLVGSNTWSKLDNYLAWFDYIAPYHHYGVSGGAFYDEDLFRRSATSLNWQVDTPMACSGIGWVNIATYQCTP